jgi:hypothetical protein
MEMTVPAGVRTYQGSCHCRAVRFEADLDLSQPASRCNCSVCAKVAQLTAIVKPPAFRLLEGEDHLSAYSFGGRTGTRYFCKTCGIHCFLRGSLEQLGGEYVSVNLNALDGVELGALTVEYFDGRHDNWMAGTRPSPWPILSPG